VISPLRKPCPYIPLYKKNIMINDKKMLISVRIPVILASVNRNVYLKGTI
jgi:hypothetical protein